MASPAEDTTFVRPQWHWRCNRCPESTKRWYLLNPIPAGSMSPSLSWTRCQIWKCSMPCPAREPWSTPHAVYRLPDSDGRKPTQSALNDLVTRPNQSGNALLQEGKSLRQHGRASCFDRWFDQGRREPL